MEVADSSHLRLTDVSKTFGDDRRRVEVLSHVDLELRSGESLAVIGPSGSGKSTLLHLVGTLDRPSDGRIELNGFVPHDLSEAELAAFRNRNVGFIFQDHHLLPQYTVLENVLVPAMAPGSPLSGDAAEERARMLLDRVGLGDRLDHRPSELSGGESQRVAVARALLQSPNLLLCDEPTGNLDQVTADAVVELLFELHRAENNILIVVTHSREIAQRFDRRVELRKGQCSEV